MRGPLLNLSTAFGGDQRSDGFVAEVACRGASSVVVSSVEGSACDKVTL